MRRMPRMNIYVLGSVVVLLTISLPVRGQDLAVGCNSPNGPNYVGVGYRTQCVVVGGTSPFDWSINGYFPSGLSLVAPRSALTRDVLVLGSPLSVGDYNYSVQVTDGSGQTASFPFAGTIPSCALSYVPYSAKADATSSPAG